MISFAKAVHQIKDAAKTAGYKEIELSDAMGRVLAEPVIADIDMPPYRKSAMDGYACRKEDLNGLLKVVEEINAGKKPEKALQVGECAKIMTGAALPANADMVIMKEDTAIVSEDRIRFTGENTNSNVCQRAEDVHVQQVICEKGQMINTPHIASLAAFGYHRVKVYKQPEVTVMATGSELVEPKIKPDPFQIRNSNSYQVLAQLQKLTLTGSYAGIIPDDKLKITARIQEELETTDILIVTGGISVGDYDFIAEITGILNFTVHFTRVAIQPGKPVIFATRGKQAVFGLSGNPVSCFLQFELLVKPYILKNSGFTGEAVEFRLPMANAHRRKKAERIGFFPVKLVNESEVKPIAFHGSAHIFSLINAFGIANFPQGKTVLEKGEKVHVRQI